jgi:hypothetical protein
LSQYIQRLKAHGLNVVIDLFSSPDSALISAAHMKLGHLMKIRSVASTAFSPSSTLSGEPGEQVFDIEVFFVSAGRIFHLFVHE